MIKYKFNLNEEIARWATEVYIKKNPQLGWWIAFTNPTAGPWKKIVVPTEEGTSAEIYRFIREEERPDLILVNDERGVILVVEAKDYLAKLITEEQMVKSIRVIHAITKILNESGNPHWAKRKTYEVIPSFLWMCESANEVQKESALVQRKYLLHRNGGPEEILNIVISKNKDEDLTNSFVYKNKVFQNLEMDFR